VKKVVRKSHKIAEIRKNVQKLSFIVRNLPKIDRFLF